MTQCIKTNWGKYMLWHRHHTLWVYDWHLCNDCITSEWLLITIFRISKNCKAIAFWTCTACCRYKYQRKCLITGFLSKYIITHITFIKCKERYSLCTIHYTSAAYCNNYIAAIFLCIRCTFCCCCCKRVLLYFIKKCCFYAGSLKTVINFII